MIAEVFGLKGNILGGPSIPTQASNGQAKAFVEGAGPIEIALNLLNLQGVGYLEKGKVVPEILNPSVGPKGKFFIS